MEVQKEPDGFNPNMIMKLLLFVNTALCAILGWFLINMHSDFTETMKATDVRVDKAFDRIELLDKTQTLNSFRIERAELRLDEEIKQLEMEIKQARK